MSLKTSFKRAGTTRSEPPGTTGSAGGPKDWSYSPKERGEKETKLSLLPRTPCRSFKRLHSAGLKKQKPRAGVATNFTMEVATS